MTRRNFSKRKLASLIGMSPPGFNTAIEKETLSIAKLEELCKVFDVPITEFFPGEAKNYVNETSGTYKKKCLECASKEGTIELLTSMLKEKEEEIKGLRAELGRELGRK
jgi:transcriptional regulator with XRE-family HTH domain